MDPSQSTCPTGSAASPYLYLLPPTLALLAVDIVLRRTSRSKEHTLPIPADPSPQTLKAPAHIAGQGPAKRKPQHALSIFTAHAEKRFLRAEVDAYYLSPTSENASSPVGSKVTKSASRHSMNVEQRTCRVLGRRSVSDSALMSSKRSSKSRGGVSPAFTNFCDAILRANVSKRPHATVLPGTPSQPQRGSESEKQVVQVATLKRSLSKERRRRSDIAFQNFCDTLLLKNKVWRAEREASLRSDQERGRKARVGVITRAAEQMVVDVRREGMIEDLVKDILEDVQKERLQMQEERERTEQEVRELVGTWKKERGAMRREMEALRKAVEAKSVEQGISNDLEDRLFEDLRRERRNGMGKDDVSVIDENTQEIEMGYNTSAFDDGEVTYLESEDDVSILSSTSTCVGSPPPSSSSKSATYPHKVKAELSIPRPRRRAYSLCCNPPPVEVKPKKVVDPSQYVGFSFNPRYFPASRPASKLSMSSEHLPNMFAEPESNLETEETESYAGERSRSESPVSMLKGRRRTVSRPTPLRATWKV